MTAKPANPLLFDASATARLACPACHGEIRPEGQGLACGACGRAYPVIDGIPVLIAERTETSPQPS